MNLFFTKVRYIPILSDLIDNAELVSVPEHRNVLAEIIVSFHCLKLFPLVLVAMFEVEASQVENDFVNGFQSVAVRFFN